MQLPFRFPGGAVLFCVKVTGVKLPIVTIRAVGPATGITLVIFGVYAILALAQQAEPHPCNNIQQVRYVLPCMGYKFSICAPCWTPIRE